MFSLERQQRRLPNKSIYGIFLARRILRIYPLSVFIVLLIALCKFPVAHFANGRFVGADLSLSDVFANVFLVQDITKADSIIAPLWSLPYEMHMYLFLPALFLLCIVVVLPALGHGHSAIPRIEQFVRAENQRRHRPILLRNLSAPFPLHVACVSGHRQHRGVAKVGGVHRIDLRIFVSHIPSA
jgi:peptidoglycan/LPS O-acetylase OafA/YrhL